MTVTKIHDTTIDVPAKVNSFENEKPNVTMEMEVTNEDDDITLEDLAPDGGWGWMIALALILVSVSIIDNKS